MKSKKQSTKKVATKKKNKPKSKDKPTKKKRPTGHLPDDEDEPFFFEVDFNGHSLKYWI